MSKLAVDMGLLASIGDLCWR